MFWSNQTMRVRLPQERVITDYDPNCVKYCAYELKLGDEAFLTSNTEGAKQLIPEREQIVIHPGQFALLITREVIRMPKKTIGFISIKAGIKFLGLVNVSGFHVDPGFEGRLKFSVYNAGAAPINLTRDKVCFLIFFADLDLASEPPYTGDHQGQMEITSRDVMDVQGELASPTVLKERITKLEHQFDIWTRVLVTILVGILLFQLKSCDDKRGLVSQPAEPEAHSQSNTASVVATIVNSNLFHTNVVRTVPN